MLSIKENVFHFYQILKFNNFTTITEDTKKELDELIQKRREVYQTNCPIFKFRFDLVIRRLTTTSHPILQSGDAKVYYLINVVDPKLDYLSVYLSCNRAPEIKEKIKTYFGFYDSNLIKLEKLYNERYQKYEESELWGRSFNNQNYLMNIASPNEKKR